MNADLVAWGCKNGVQNFLERRESGRFRTFFPGHLRKRFPGNSRPALRPADIFGRIFGHIFGRKPGHEKRTLALSPSSKGIYARPERTDTDKHLRTCRSALSVRVCVSGRPASCAAFRPGLPGSCFRRSRRRAGQANSAPSSALQWVCIKNTLCLPLSPSERGRQRESEGVF